MEKNYCEALGSDADIQTEAFPVHCSFVVIHPSSKA